MSQVYIDIFNNFFNNSVHLYNYLAGIYLNTQEADTKCMKFESQQTYIPTCERSHVLVTYQTLAY